LKRQKRRQRWDSLFDSRELVIAGFLAVLLFLFNPSTLGRGGQFLFFWFCAWASGKKNRPLITLSVIAAVILVNLLAPYGRVLAEIGPLSITAGSLAMGFRRGITLEGLFMLSAALVRAKTQGRPGPAARRGGGALRQGFRSFRRLLEESLALFAALNDGRGLIRPGHITGDLDSLFLGMDSLSPAEPSPPEPGKAGAGEGRSRGRLLLALGLFSVAVFTALPVFFTG
jgi:heptaprenyl diphosphate synthase